VSLTPPPTVHEVEDDIKSSQTLATIANQVDYDMITCLRTSGLSIDYADDVYKAIRIIVIGEEQLEYEEQPEY
jgi:hypothetical protein